MPTQPVKPPAACPKCKSGRTSVMGIASTDPPLQLLRCAACGHTFTTGGKTAST